MQTVVQKWGNSLGIRIPNFYVKEFQLKNGSQVDVVEEEGKLVIKPNKLTLEFLLSQINDENKHEAIDTGASVGKEEW
jgi:antitoxin MazE